MEGQIEALSGEINVEEENGDWKYINTPWDDDSMNKLKWRSEYHEKVLD